jgi:hypothetical protein
VEYDSEKALRNSDDGMEPSLKLTLGQLSNAPLSSQNLTHDPRRQHIRRISRIEIYDIALEADALSEATRQNITASSGQRWQSARKHRGTVNPKVVRT